MVNKEATGEVMCKGKIYRYGIIHKRFDASTLTCC